MKGLRAPSLAGDSQALSSSRATRWIRRNSAKYGQPGGHRAASQSKRGRTFVRSRPDVYFFGSGKESRLEPFQFAVFLSQTFPLLTVPGATFVGRGFSLCRGDVFGFELGEELGETGGVGGWLGMGAGLAGAAELCPLFGASERGATSRSDGALSSGRGVSLAIEGASRPCSRASQRYPTTASSPSRPSAASADQRER